LQNSSDDAPQLLFANYNYHHHLNRRPRTTEKKSLHRKIYLVIQRPQEWKHCTSKLAILPYGPAEKERRGARAAAALFPSAF
jgi:hypothetical protein